MATIDDLIRKYCSIQNRVEDKVSDLWSHKLLPLILIVVILILIPINILVEMDLIVIFFINLIIILLVFLLIGWVLKRQPLGLLISPKNRVSLSRFQITLWSVLILSAILTVFLRNVRLEDTDPLSFKIPTELLVLMGISGASTAGSSLVLATKDPGSLDKRTHPSQARFSDIFKYDDLFDKDYVDISKVQMFFFTIILVVGYAILLIDLFSTDSIIEELPALSYEMIGLIGISHAGYIGRKAVPKDPTKTLIKLHDEFNQLNRKHKRKLIELKDDDERKINLKIENELIEEKPIKSSDDIEILRQNKMELKELEISLPRLANEIRYIEKRMDEIDEILKT